ncbi:uncharacterized protein LOC124492735 [Dermatophagoides farinae]|uniref:Uncharacterized protein n=1 Tax=Dermatophagoides farinae TaxID=6954 RepID=A0A9D4SH68_DERFA|nr:uncharacterized protein LOC124492735 [Dermatophagoides farinae]KAH7642294.1 hypothetical protein HUG17_5339 [Dermatophagoides farinae]
MTKFYWTISLVIILALILHVHGHREKKSYEEECENEEEMVEICGRDFLIYTNETMASTEAEMDTFCRIYKEKERCLRDHSNKCLSHSANQAIMELIRTISNKNRIICSSKQRRNVQIRANHCLNQQRLQRPNFCYNGFVQRIHGIHQYSQEEKIPIICCNYHEFLTCLRNQLKSCAHNLINNLLKLIQNYSGETLNYVCREYRNSNKCQNNGMINDDNVINEARPKTFFSLLVKIYLS